MPVLAVLAGLAFVIAAILAWVDKTISVPHLLAIGFAGLALLAGHFIWGWWGEYRGRPVA